MMFLTKEQLTALIGKRDNIDQWLAALNSIPEQYEINTPIRFAMFFAQCAHESANFTQLKENLNYSADALRKVFGKYFTSVSLAEQYARKPEKIANKVYANRMGNGIESSGDGWKFCGHGIMQITGKANHQAFADHCKITLDQAVTYLQTPEGAVKGACWYWSNNHLNQHADREDVDAVSDIINRGHQTAAIGDAIGYKDRLAKYQSVLNIIGKA